MHEVLKVSFESKTHWMAGGLSEQPDWWVDLVAWFYPVYDDSKFYSRAKSILGDGKSANRGPVGPSEGLSRGGKKG